MGFISLNLSLVEVTFQRAIVHKNDTLSTITKLQKNTSRYHINQHPSPKQGDK
jgi:hypothetical protein